ncbi:DUF4191 domain-containing protein [Luteococcus peritonei]|uniref:DUF4191 domain-containing protein n=1 Tax=Luteococcus peritonei TaxID=88874 RepID=A0ABW4RT36_9ACTN
MASEKAKELRAQQKAQIKAEKERKKNSSDPRDWSQMRQLRESYRLTQEADPQLPWVLAAGFLVPFLVCLLLGLFVFEPVWLWIPLGIMAGLSLALFLFTRRVKKSVYTRYEGQPGSAEIALNMLGKDWHSTPAITATRSMDVVHRVVGPGGLILVGEGDPKRLKQLLATEVKRHEQTAYGVKVQTVQMGDGQGQVPLAKLADHIKKMPKTLTKVQVDDVTKRLRAMDAVRSRVPLPKGPLPQQGSRRAMRGR